MGRSKKLESNQFYFRVPRHSRDPELDSLRKIFKPGLHAVRGERKRVTRSTNPKRKALDNLRGDFGDLRLGKSHSNATESRRLLNYKHPEPDASRSLLGKLPGAVDPTIDEYWTKINIFQYLKNFTKNYKITLQNNIDKITGIMPLVRADGDHSRYVALAHNRRILKKFVTGLAEFNVMLDDTPKNHKVIPNISKLEEYEGMMRNILEALGDRGDNEAALLLSRMRGDRGALSKKSSKKKPTKKKPTKKKPTKKKPTKYKKKSTFKKKYY